MNSQWPKAFWSWAKRGGQYLVRGALVCSALVCSALLCIQLSLAAYVWEQPLEQGIPGQQGIQREQPLKPWYEIPVISHAMGTVDGRTGTNSADAFFASYQAGQRVFEVDLQLTSDGVLVARHDWDQISYYNLEQTYMEGGVMDWATFMSTPICYYYTPLDISNIIDLMEEYPDIYIVTDSKETDRDTVCRQMQALAWEIQSRNHPQLWDRIIVQIYHKEMYDWIVQRAPVTNWIFTVYQLVDPDFEDLGAFCQERGIKVITIPSDRLTKERSQAVHRHGCRLYLHTVNRLLEMVQHSWAADGYYSDYVTTDQLERVRRGTNKMLLSTFDRPIPSAANGLNVK